MGMRAKSGGHMKDRLLVVMVVILAALCVVPAGVAAANYPVIPGQDPNCKATIIGFKYNDKQGNHIFDNGDKTLNGWRIWLKDPQGNILAWDETNTFPTTNDKGYYCFGDCTCYGLTNGKDMTLADGTYVLSERLKPNWGQTEPVSEPVPSDTYSITVAGANLYTSTPTSHPGLPFGNLKIHGGEDVFSICGLKISQTTQQVVPGWTIQLIQNNNVIASTTTDQDGEYCFSELAPGTYTVQEVLQNGWQYGVPPLGKQQVTIVDDDILVDFFNLFTGTVPVPEFPTVGVSLAILTGIGFIVFTLRQKKF
jgi:hypothetical protein